MMSGRSPASSCDTAPQGVFTRGATTLFQPIEIVEFSGRSPKSGIIPLLDGIMPVEKSLKLLGNFKSS